jgi:hypothetical protein
VPHFEQGAHKSHDNSSGLHPKVNAADKLNAADVKDPSRQNEIFFRQRHRRINQPRNVQMLTANTTCLLAVAIDL